MSSSLGGTLQPGPRVRRAADRIRRHVASLLLAGAAAGIAYAIASAAFGPTDAFFAPIAAVVCTGITAGHRTRRAIEITAGVTLGIVFADLLVRAIGGGPPQLGIAVLVAMTGAVTIGASPLMANQAAVAAILVVVLSADTTANPWTRLGDALIGGAVALVLNAVVGRDRQRPVRDAAEAILAGLEDALAEVGAALRDRDRERAEAAHECVDRLGRRLAELDDALSAARDTARLARGRQRSLARLQPQVLLRARLEHLASTVRALVRGSANAVRHGQAVDPHLIDAIDELRTALGRMRPWVSGDTSAEAARDSALQAAGTASELLRVHRPLTTNVLVGQVRSGAIDVLRATGIEQQDAVATLEAAAGRADDHGSGRER